MFWDIIKYGFMSVMLKQTRDVKALIVVYLYLLELSKSENGFLRILYNWTRRYLGLEDIFKTCVFKLLCNLCKPGWLLGMRSKHITAYRIPGLAKIDGDLVFPLCVEEGGGTEFLRPNRIVSILFCGHVLNTLYLWTRCLDMADIKPRTSRFMTANNIMRDVHIYQIKHLHCLQREITPSFRRFSAHIHFNRHTQVSATQNCVNKYHWNRFLTIIGYK